jgi:ferredoxin-NADP reductase
MLYIACAIGFPLTRELITIPESRRTMTTSTLALIILVAILAQLAFVGLLGLYRRRRQHRVPHGHDGESRTLPAAAISEMPTNGPSSVGETWTGFREFSVQRREFEDEGQSICSFYLMPCDGKPLPPFRPGQFLTFRLPIGDSAKAKPNNVVRCYSLSDSPRPDYYRVSIKRVPAPPDQPDVLPGISSGYFHDHVQVGDRLMVRAPSGHFHLVEDEPLPIVLIGGGIGLTPMLSILNSVLERSVGRGIWLYYGVRNGSEHVMKRHLRALADRHDNFHLHVCYSAPGEGDVEGVDYDHRGRVDLHLLRNTLRLARYQFYVCGPKQMMESLVPGLEQWGVDSGDIHYESFGPAALVKREKPAQIAGSTRPFSVTFTRSGESLNWDPTADSLLEFAEANGIDVDSGCRAGSCGSCQTTLKAGTVDYSQQPDADIEPGHCLLCIATPSCDLVLEA